MYYYYRINERGPDNQWHASQVKSIAQNCGARAVASSSSNSNRDCQSSTAETCDYSSNDTLLIPSLGTGARCSGGSVKAPVNVYDVGADGAMGIPVADCDVVRENFAAFPGFGGYPGDGGTTVLAGHVDYHPNYIAVFWYLKDIRPGDEIQYVRGDGKVIKYTVDWAQAISDPSYDWGSLARATQQESLVLITCEGTFNPETHEYDKRRVVHAVRQG